MWVPAIVLFLQELQRRLDQTLGKPGSYLAGIDRVGNVKPMTVGARLYRVEQQVNQPLGIHFIFYPTIHISVAARLQVI